MIRFSKGLSLLIVLGVVFWLSAEQKKSEAAFVLLPYGWAGNTADYQINSNFPSSSGTPENVSFSIQQAAAAWTDQACSNFQFQYQGPTTVATTGYDGVNAVYWTPLSGGATAAQTQFFAVSTGGGPLMIEEFDIRFFADHDHVSQAQLLTDVDIQGLATHEFGHAAGLDHSTISASPLDLTAPTMAATFSGRDQSIALRSLEQEDIDGINAWYGQSSTCPPSTTFPEGSFEASPAGGLPGAPWVVTGGATLHVVRPNRGATADNGFPTEGSQWCDLVTEGSSAVGIRRSFVFDPDFPVLSFDAAFVNGEQAPQFVYNDFMTVEISDGTTTEVLYYADTNTATPTNSTVHALPMTELTSVKVILSELFSGVTANTQFTLRAFVSNAGDSGVPSFGYLDNFDLSSTTIVLEDGMSVLEDFECWTGGYRVDFGVWEYGVPANSFISGAASGTKAWVTGLASGYPNNANGRLITPSIDCTALTEDPIVSFKQIFQIEAGFDVVRLEMSVDGGVYLPVGAPGDAGNWFSSLTGLNGMGWDGTSGAAGQWRTAAHVLDGAAGHVVKLLFRMRSDFTVVQEGMGIDDVILAAHPGGQPPRPGIASLDMLSPSFGHAVSTSNKTPVDFALPGPYEMRAEAGVDWLNLYFEGFPNEPILLLAGPPNVGAAEFPGVAGNQIDLGTAPTFGDVSVIANGSDPGFLNALYVLGANGSKGMSLGVLPVGLSGYHAAFQAFYLNGGFRATNAVVLTIE
jgi:Matrixin/Immune inhibitor A-like, MAM domain